MKQTSEHWVKVEQGSRANMLEHAWHVCRREKGTTELRSYSNSRFKADTNPTSMCRAQPSVPIHSSKRKKKNKTSGQERRVMAVYVQFQ